MHARLIQSTRHVARLATAGARFAAPAPAALPRAMYVRLFSPAFAFRRGVAWSGGLYCVEGTFGTSTRAHGAVVVEEAQARLMANDRFDPPLLSAFQLYDRTSHAVGEQPGHIPLDGTSSGEMSAVAQGSPEFEEKTSRTVFVGNMSWNTDEEWLGSEIQKVLNVEEPVTALRIARDQQGRSKGFGFVELKDAELAHQLTRLMEPLSVDGREVNFSQANRPVNMLARGDGQSRGRRPDTEFEIRAPRFPPSSTIYVGNIAWSADEVTLEEIFGQYGQILRIFQPKDRETGRAIGVAFIEYESVDEASAAVEAGQKRINVDGRPVQIDFASGRKDAPTGGRGGPRGGDRFGGRQGGASRDRDGGQDRRASFGGERGSYRGGERY
ncbi:ribonucleoprotein [Rhodotorula toruloides]|uniref:Ribonucleoprotein n=1 Tax=Rhodotorula toruloides TaxID=5286 RepID=A0A511KGD9_RHOTO|nr:ribonucleoprotein [Rhodotorula toruloides]